MSETGGGRKNDNVTRFLIIFGGTFAAIIAAMVACTALVGGLSWLDGKARIRELCETGVRDPSRHLMQMKLAGMPVSEWGNAPAAAVLMPQGIPQGRDPWRVGEGAGHRACAKACAKHGRTCRHKQCQDMG